MSEWIKVSDCLPKCFDEVLFTEGTKVFYGWLASYQDGENLFWVRTSGFPDHSSVSFQGNVTHWMELPSIPGAISISGTLSAEEAFEKLNALPSVKSLMKNLSKL